MSATPPSPLSSRLLDPKSLLDMSIWKLNKHLKRSTSRVTLLISIRSTSTSSQSLPSQAVGTFSLQWLKPKLSEEESLSLLFLSHTPFDLSGIPVLCILKTVPHCDPFSPPSLLLSRSKPLSPLAWLLQWHPKYPSWDHPCPSSVYSQRYSFVVSPIKSFLCLEPFNSLSYSEETVVFKMA